MEDVCLGRSTQIRQTVVAIGAATSVQLCKADANRVHLRIGVGAAGAITVSFSVPADVNTGIRIPTQADPIELDIKHDGLIVTGEMFAFSTPGDTITIWETILPEACEA